MPDARLTVSIVSHRQNALVNGLLGDLARHCGEDILIVLTENVPDTVSFATEPFAGRMQVIRNPKPKGFGANHNAAFTHCRTPYFCVCNPDIRLTADPFPVLLQALAEQRVAVAGPLVRNPDGHIEDSARRFPTAGILLKKLFFEKKAPDYPTDCGPLEVDWIAGMFMLFGSVSYRNIAGFDERYFLYYEDVDLCHRLRAGGKTIIYEPRAEVIHDARRESRRSPRLALHHAASALRFLASRTVP